MSSHTRSITALLAAAVLSACTGAARGAAQTSPPVGVGLAAGDSAWTQADVEFMSSMIGHHAQAVEMARLAPERAQSESVKTLAARIISAQVDEIATMQQWLRDRGQPVPEPHPTSHGMHEMMPGMLTPEQFAQLEAARGPEFDRLFLTLMIQHHRGAVAMVERLFGSYGAGQDEAVFKFASDVNVDQATEIARMQRMLADLLFGSPSP
ncbi:MAG TPA: DUF305 domain-containing protein [Longimicrobium sp.]|nr:DUF305 domain-containing protein [Longimicrobium sp.]